MVPHPVFDIAPGELARLRALTPDQALQAASASRDSVLSTRQLHALGFRAPALTRKLGQRRLHHLHRGVYAVGRPDLRRNGWRRAAVLRFGRRAVLVESTAGTLLDLLEPRDRVSVAVPGRPARPAASSGIRLRYSAVWLPGDVIWVEGLPCTSVARTLADLAASGEERAFARAWDAADGRQLIDVGAVREQIARERPGVGLLRARLERYTASAPLESVLEELFFDLCAQHGLPRPICQWPLEAGDRSGRVDFVFVDLGVAVEVDGRAWHATQTAFAQDRERDLELRELGFDPHRYTYWQVRDEGPRVAAAVATALEERRARGTFR